jgi:hypothetical protein
MVRSRLLRSYFLIALLGSVICLASPAWAITWAKDANPLHSDWNHWQQQYPELVHVFTAEEVRTILTLIESRTSKERAQLHEAFRKRPFLFTYFVLSTLGWDLPDDVADRLTDRDFQLMSSCARPRAIPRRALAAEDPVKKAKKLIRRGVESSSAAPKGARAADISTAP